MQKQKLAWFVGYVDLCTNKNIYKKHISASPMIRFRDRAFKISMNFLTIIDKQIW